MRVGLIGSGGMGEGMSCHIMKNNVEVWGYTNDYSKTQEHYEKGHISGCTTTLEYLAYVVHNDNKEYTSTGKTPGVFLLTLPTEAVDAAINDLVEHCMGGDVIIHNGDFNFKDFRRRSETLSKFGIQFVDCDTSNDSVQVTGPKTTISICSSIFKSLAPNSSWNEFATLGAVC
jgi:6-phosphogluconate dehydrogenase (decarboxylating)